MLAAWDIQELPLLAANFYMKTGPMAGKCAPIQKVSQAALTLN